MPEGMTLIEILVVIAIVGVVSAAVAIGVVGVRTDAEKESTRDLVEDVSGGVASYATAKGALPESLTDLVAERFIERRDTLDAWSNRLSYEPGGSGRADDFTLCSLGPDGALGSEDDICTDPR